MISVNNKMLPPQVRPPMPNGLDQPYNLALIGNKLVVASSERPAEEGKGSGAPVEDDTKPCARRVAVHREHLVEIRHLQHWRHREGAFQRLEGGLGVVIPSERVSPQETRQRCREDAEVLNKFLFVAGEPQEAPQSPCRTWSRSRRDRRDLVGVHGNPLGGDDMAEVGDGGGPKRTLGTLEVQAVSAEGVEDDPDVLQVLRPGRADISMSSEKTNTNLWRYGLRTSFISAWKVAEALERLKGITKNS